MARFHNHEGAARSNPGGPYAIIARMVGREPDRDVRERIEAVRSALDARDDDAIWVVLGIFESVIDRAHRVYRSYVRCLILAACVEIAVQIVSMSVTEARLMSNETAMRAEVVDAIRQAACGGIGEQAACEAARINAASPARQAVVRVVSRLPDGLVNALAGTPDLDQWLAWMSRSVAEKAAQGAAEAHKTGKVRDAH